MKLTDYIAKYLSDRYIDTVFGVTGGSVVHIFDSIDKQSGIKNVFHHHEQAATYAASSYSRVNGMACAVVTTGPGGANAISGVVGMFLDSIPCLIISGQTMSNHCTTHKPIRQIGSQALDIISLVRTITKERVILNNPKDIKKVLDYLFMKAKTGRPGPVWLDIPLDYQWAEVDEEKLKGSKVINKNPRVSRSDFSKLNKMLKKSTKPIILAGNGIKLAGATNKFRKLIDETSIPFVTTWNTHDIYPGDMHMGCAGLCINDGTREILEKCDLLIGLGTHFSLPLVRSDDGEFLPNAKKIVVDIDSDELDFQLIESDLSIYADVRTIIPHILWTKSQEWISDCMKTRRFPTWEPYDNYVNPYRFVNRLSRLLPDNANIAVDGGGTIIYIAFRAIKPKLGQNIMIDAGIAAMGSGLPNAIGAYYANENPTICLCGDGSVQMNVQELQTVVHHKIPIKMFVMNNGGYLAIRHTQASHLDKNYVGSEPKGGMSLPDYSKIAKAYGVKYFKIENDYENTDKIVQKVLDYDGPVICEFMVNEDQEVSGGLV